MVRVLSRDEADIRRAAIFDAEPSHALVALGSPKTHEWFGRPVDAEERNRVSDAAAALLYQWIDRARGDTARRTDSRRPVERLLTWLDSLPGESYQDRWLAADPDSHPRAWCPELTAGAARRTAARQAANALIILGVIRPSVTWLFDNKQSRFWRDWTITHDQEFWDRYFAAAEQAHAPQRQRWWAAQQMIRICVVHGLSVTDVTGQHVLDFRKFLQDTDRSAGTLHAMWHFARLAGALRGEPDELGALTKATQQSPEQLVDRYKVAAPSVRALLVDYTTEMSTSKDYASLANATTILVRTFWKAIEDANPGIDTIQLTTEQASAWKEWLRTKEDGSPRRNVDSVLGAVRAFYLDLAAWAHEDPARWAQWAVPCPISVRDVRGSGRRRRTTTHRMQARTRSLAPHLPALVARAEERYAEALALRDKVQAVPVGDEFTHSGRTYLRAPTTRTAASTSYVTVVGQPGRLDTDWNVVRTFMTWMIVDVLRHTGLRIEEMLELTHLSVRRYRKPDGSILPLLQVAPSKTDEERIIPCSPELTAALARLIQFVSMDGRVPSCRRRDDHERVYSEALPHLFQLREAGRSRSISPGTVRNWLTELANDLHIRDVDGEVVVFTPHDFRRLYITELVNSGFPIHLAARLVGHTSLDVTSAYTAVYQKDIFEAYENFISKRRALRPSEEYREPTQAEWDEFIEHFGRRKIALGDCHRPYGADCVHEHACIRCDFLQVDPGQAQRLQDIRGSLVAQVDEAERNRWLGDVDQLRRTIAHADRKAEQLQHASVHAAPALVTARACADEETPA